MCPQWRGRLRSPGSRSLFSRTSGRPRALSDPAIAAALILGIGGCVEAFDGSVINMTLSAGILSAGDDGEPGRPPADTHFELYAVKSGQLLPIFQPFDVKPFLDFGDPCLIEDPAYPWVQFPGIHISRIADKLREEALSDGDVTDREAADIAAAQLRLRTAMARGANLRAVVAHDATLSSADLAAFRATVAPASAFDDASNAARLAACTDFFQAHPDYYVGSDMLLQVATNGKFLGMVDGTDPKDATPVGGWQWFEPAHLDEFDAIRLNWQFDAPTEEDLAEYGPSSSGYHYMAGTGSPGARGVIQVALSNSLFPSISGVLAIAANVGDTPEW